uniref:ATP synthase complex subunit 8 n=1 Tax=Sphaerius sp. BT0074 TaxID=546487 RepID=B6D8U7_9COLE|nr:ATP synthase F0 subunit 8 [Sphaerius sp. BT0074]ACF35085.1 ATP synthase F0 subunit 8 [Sphaerius sp. BT0074]
MPQMAPMNWIMLFLYFTMIFIMFNSLNYFMFTKKNMNFTKNNFLQKTMFWKW